MTPFDELTQQLDLRLVVGDDVVADYPTKVKCREHKDPSASLAVYRDHLHCFGCGWHEAKPLAALAYLLKVELAEAVKQAPRYMQASLDAYRERVGLEVASDPLPTSLASLYHTVLATQRKHRLQWLYDRGLNDKTLARFLVGHDGNRYVIPIFDAAGRLMTLRYRRDDEYADDRATKYLGLKGRNGRYLYCERTLAEEQPAWVAICEGEFDCMRLWQDGIPAVTVTNGAGQLHAIPALLQERFPLIRTVIVAGDMDEPGQAAANQTIEAAKGLGFRTALLTWLEGKDVSEALLAGSLNPAAIKKLAKELVRG